MKKTLPFIVLMALFMSELSQAQGIRYGFKAGINASSIANLSFDLENVNNESLATIPSEAEDGRINFTASFFAEMPINDRISFQPEFMFSSQGNKYVGFKTDYLQIPLALRVNVGKLFVLAGPQPGIKISFFEQSDDFESIDFSAFGALGYQFGENLFIEARYTLGFVEIFSADANVPIEVANEGSNTVNTDTRFTNVSGKNTYISVMFGYRL